MSTSTRAVTVLTSRLRTFGPGIADVGISSLGNFIIAVEAARVLSLSKFGGVQAAIFVTVLVVGAARSFLGDAFVLAGRSEATFGRHRPDQLLGAALLLSLPASLAMLVCAGVGLAPLGLVAPLALCLPGMLVQDAARFAEHARHRPGRAVANSSVWTSGLLLAVGLRRAFGLSYGPHELVLLWGATAVAAGAAGCIMLGVLPRPSKGWAWLRESAREGSQLVGDFLLLQVTTVLPVLLLGAVAGYTELGVLRMGQIPLGPLVIIVNGTSVFLQPHLASIRRTAGADGVAREARHVALLLGSALAIAATIVYLLPLSIISHVVGENWREAHKLVPALGIELCAGLVGAVYGIALRVHRRVRAQVIARIFITPFTLALTVGLSAPYGATGAAWGLAASGTTLAACWVFLNRRLDDAT